MGTILHLVTCLVCIQAALSHPVQDDGSPLYDDYRMSLAKRDSFYPFRESILSTLGFMDTYKGWDPTKLSITGNKWPCLQLCRFVVQVAAQMAPHSATNNTAQEGREKQQGLYIQALCGKRKRGLGANLHYMLCTKEGTRSQRKKAVDSTFIRFGRSSPSEPGVRTVQSSDEVKTLLDDQNTSTENTKISLPQRFILNHNNCKITNSRELVHALMNDRNCVRAFQKVKRENVNDTFIRFGKRSVPSEDEFESQNDRGRV